MSILSEAVKRIVSVKRRKEKPKEDFPLCTITVYRCLNEIMRIKQRDICESHDYYFGYRTAMQQVLKSLLDMTKKDE